MPDEENLPVLVVSDTIAYTDDERFLVDGQPVAPGRYRLQLGDEGGQMPVLTVAGDDEQLTVISAADLN
ncbi:hypothetical protein [Streptosporangium sp. NPDC000509]|uniref:hypothetical protein n=1 Tax=Streptosporangium sp. NPDC000509 TaxID=3366186 RepID=UPI0036C0FA57